MATLAFVSTPKLIQLLNAADPGGDMYVRLFNLNMLALGRDPLKPSHIIDLSSERARQYHHSDFPHASEQPSVHPVNVTYLPVSKPDPSKVIRRTGDHWFEIRGQRFICRSLREMLSGGLRELEKAQPGTLDKLSQIKPRSRRIVAQDPKELFEKEHLSQAYAERLVNGWWYGTNNSADETQSWLERACSCAGLKWGDDFKTSLMVTDEDLLA